MVYPSSLPALPFDEGTEINDIPIKSCPFYGHLNNFDTIVICKWGQSRMGQGKQGKPTLDVKGVCLPYV